MIKRLSVLIVWLTTLGGAYLLGQRHGALPLNITPTAPLENAAGSLAQRSLQSEHDSVKAADADADLMAVRDWDALASRTLARGNLENLLNLADSLAADGRTEDAIELLNALLRRDVSHRALFVLSDVYMMDGQMQAALEPLFRILDYPETPEVADRARQRLNLIINTIEQQLSNAQDVAGLLAFFEMLAAREPGYDRHRYRLAHWLAKTGDPIKASELLQQVGSVGVSDAEREQLANEISAASRQLPFEREGNGYFADVSVSGMPYQATRQLRLLVDTGATTTSLAEDSLKAMGARQLDRRVRVATANGVTEMATYRLNTLEVGDLEVSDLVVLGLADPPRGVDGLLGMDVLDRLPKAVGTP